MRINNPLMFFILIKNVEHLSQDHITDNYMVAVVSGSDNYSIYGNSSTFLDFFKTIKNIFTR